MESIISLILDSVLWAVVVKTQLISHCLIEHFRIDRILGSFVSLLNTF